MRRSVLGAVLVFLSAACAQADSVTYTNAWGSILTAAGWEGGAVPSGTVTGLITSANTDLWTSYITGVPLRQTGGYLHAASTDVAINGDASASVAYEIEDADTDYESYTNFYVSGTLSSWSGAGKYPPKLNILSGHVEVGTLAFLNGAGGKVTVNMRNGIFHAAIVSGTAFKLNMLPFGAGEVVFDSVTASSYADFYADFSTGNCGSITIGESGGTSALGAVNWMFNQGHFLIDGVVADKSGFTVAEDGNSVSIALVRPPAGLSISCASDSVSLHLDNLSWGANSNVLQVTDSLLNPVWEDVLVCSGVLSTNWVDDSSSSGQRFYRMQIFE
jgi:hypothetical protein